MESPIIIQINNIKALERLLGNGDDIPFQMGVRNSVAQAFANRHFNALERTPEIQEAIRDAQLRGKAIQAAAQEQMHLAIGNELGTLTKKSHWDTGYVFTLSEEMKQRIKMQAIAACEDLVVAEVKRVVEEYDIPKTIAEAVDRKINQQWAASINTEVAKKLDEVKKLI